MRAVVLRLRVSMLAEVVELARGMGAHTVAHVPRGQDLARVVVTGSVDQVAELLDALVPTKGTWTMTGATRRQRVAELLEEARRHGGVARAVDHDGVARLEVWGDAAVRAVDVAIKGRSDFVFAARGAVGEA